MTGIAIIGLGNIGEVHLRNLQSLRGCRVTGYYDPRTRTGPGVPSYESLDALLADSSANAVVVATPSASHADLALRALKAGKHVFLEKPLASSVEDSVRIAEASARHAGLIVQVGFCERFNPQYLEAKRAADQGLLGSLRSIRTSRVAPLRYCNPDWDLGVLDTAVHNLDLILWLKQAMPVSVLTRGAAVYGSTIPHSATTLLTFVDGSLAADHIAWLRDDHFPLSQCARAQMFLQGSEGFFEVDLTDRPSAMHTESGYHKIDSVILGAAEYPGCLKLQFEYFLRAVEEGGPVLAPVEDALRVERVALAALESLRTGKEIALAE
jgi:predicted dehydrogenase